MEISLLPSKTPSQSKKMTSAMKAKSDFMGEATRDKMSDLYDMIVALRNKVKELEKYHFEATEYNFVSYGDDKGEKKYATGKVRTTGEYITLNTSEYVEVKVIENSVEEFVGRKFYIISTAEENGKLYQLYVYNEETQILSADKLWVKLGEDTDEGSSDSGSSEPDDSSDSSDSSGTGEFEPIHYMMHLFDLNDQDEGEYSVESTEREIEYTDSESGMLFVFTELIPVGENSFYYVEKDELNGITEEYNDDLINVYSNVGGIYTLAHRAYFKLYAEEVEIDDPNNPGDDPEEPIEGEETIAGGQTYNFVSYADQAGTTQYATGKVVTTGITREYHEDSYTEVEVTENSVEGFVGNKYYVPSDAKLSSLMESGTYIYQLYEYNEGGDVLNPVDIYVKITRVMQQYDPSEPGIGNLPVIGN